MQLPYLWLQYFVFAQKNTFTPVRNSIVCPVYKRDVTVYMYDTQELYSESNLVNGIFACGLDSAILFGYTTNIPIKNVFSRLYNSHSQECTALRVLAGSSLGFSAYKPTSYVRFLPAVAGFFLELQLLQPTAMPNFHQGEIGVLLDTSLNTSI